MRSRPSSHNPVCPSSGVWLDNVDVQLLISQLNSDLYSRYPEPGALIFSLETADIVDGVGTLLMAELDGEPVGCGASESWTICRARPRSSACTSRLQGEERRSAVLCWPSSSEWARTSVFGVSRSRPAPDSQRRWGSAAAGYVVCEPWGPFVGKEFSICMEKVLPSG